MRRPQQFIARADISRPSSSDSISPSYSVLDFRMHSFRLPPTSASFSRTSLRPLGAQGPGSVTELSLESRLRSQLILIIAARMTWMGSSLHAEPSVAPEFALPPGSQSTSPSREWTASAERHEEGQSALTRPRSIACQALALWRRAMSLVICLSEIGQRRPYQMLASEDLIPSMPGRRLRCLRGAADANCLTDGSLTRSIVRQSGQAEVGPRGPLGSAKQLIRGSSDNILPIAVISTALLTIVYVQDHTWDTCSDARTHRRVRCYHSQCVVIHLEHARNRASSEKLWISPDLTSSTAELGILDLGCRP